MPYCPNCGNAIAPDSYFCPFCGTATPRLAVPERRVPPPTTMPARLFAPERVSVGEVFSASWSILTQRPIIIIPHLLSTLVGTLLGGGLGMFFGAFFRGFGAGVAPRAIAAFLVVVVISTTIEGLYPRLTKRILDGTDVDLGGAASQVLDRFFSLFGAAILLALIGLVGASLAAIGFVLSAFTPEMPALALIGLISLVLGAILTLYLNCWFYCAIPALMLEDRGVFDALSASKTFSQGRKWAIFGLVVIVSLISGILNSVAGLILGVVGGILRFLVALILTVYSSVLPSYLYIRYGGPRVAPSPPAPVTPVPVAPMPVTKEICPTCGAEIEPGQSYCGWCGSKLS